MTQDLRELAGEEFAAAFGVTPIGVWSAPGAVTLLGGDAEGLSLAFAIDRRAFVAVGARDDARIRAASTLVDEVAEIALAELAPDAVDGWAAYPLGVAWALGELGYADLGAVPGVDILIESDVPVGAGLSSSAALVTAVAGALSELWRLDLDSRALARVARAAERDVVGARPGGTNQLVSLSGRAGGALLVDGPGGEAQPVALGFAAHDLAILVIDTQLDLAPGGPRGARYLAAENERVLEAVVILASERPHAIGPLLDASHRSLRDAGGSASELDLAAETAQSAGALGARAAGGGSVIALVPRGLVSHVQVAVDGAFAEHGYGQPVTFTVTPSDGARRDL